MDVAQVTVCEIQRSEIGNGAFPFRAPVRVEARVQFGESLIAGRPLVDPVLTAPFAAVVDGLRRGHASESGLGG